MLKTKDTVLEIDNIVKEFPVGKNGKMTACNKVSPVSYTHLDVYKRQLLGGTAVVEVIFSYPGLGNLAVTSITAYDYPVIQAYVLWIALIYMIINLIVDLSYTLVAVSYTHLH